MTRISGNHLLALNLLSQHFCRPIHQPEIMAARACRSTIHRGEHPTTQTPQKSEHSQSSSLVDLPEKVAAGQLVDVVVQYIFSHPSIRQLKADELFYDLSLGERERERRRPP